MTGKQKKALLRILASLVLLIAAVLVPAKGWVRLVLFLIPLLFCRRLAGVRKIKYQIPLTHIRRWLTG